MIRQPTQRIPIVCMVVLTAMIGSLGVGHVFVRHDAIRLGYEFTKVSEELRKLREEHRRLLLEKAVLTAPDRIEVLAKKIGMRQPSETQIRAVTVNPVDRDSLATHVDPARQR